MVVEQDVSVRLQCISVLSLGAGSHFPVVVVWYVLFPKLPEPLHLQGTFSNLSGPEDKGS